LLFRRLRDQAGRARCWLAVATLAPSSRPARRLLPTPACNCPHAQLPLPLFPLKPSSLRQVEGAMKGLKDDPEMGEIFAELESGGPAAMMK
jgi:hypothetical protein